MKTATFRLLPILTTIVLAIAFGGCQKKKAQDTPAEGSAPVTETDIDGGMADSDSGKAMGLQTIHYGYDSSILDSSAKAALKANAQILKDKSNLKVQIEGHTDDRGGIQYNLALGERRANAARIYLVDLGVDGTRIETISYGEEKPIQPGHDESAWSKNRRANFRITQQ
ncbi:MAG: peptidoglycan-associated lipoprotein Pal [Bdellovibrionota bacterium]